MTGTDRVANKCSSPIYSLTSFFFLTPIHLESRYSMLCPAEQMRNKALARATVPCSVNTALLA